MLLKNLVFLFFVILIQINGVPTGGNNARVVDSTSQPAARSRAQTIDAVPANDEQSDAMEAGLPVASPIELPVTDGVLERNLMSQGNAQATQSRLLQFQRTHCTRANCAMGGTLCGICAFVAWVLATNSQ